MNKWRLSLVVMLMMLFAMPIHAQDSDDENYAIALERIQEALDTGAIELWLYNLNLAQVPSEIGQLTNLGVVQN